MITSSKRSPDELDTDRILVIADESSSSSLFNDVRRRYPELNCTCCATYLSGIAELSRHPARAVVAWVDPALAQIGDAVAGLRTAAGADTRVILCCTPQTEPIARRVIDEGADDYVLYPLAGDELDALIGYARLDTVRPPIPSPEPAVTLNELRRLGEVMATLGRRPMLLLEKLADLVRTALHARGVTVIVQGSVATAGDVVVKPVLTAPLKGSYGVMGQLTIGEHITHAYTPEDVDRLFHYATIAGYVLQAASDQRDWRQLAMTDECSGLPNRRFFHDKLGSILTQAAVDQFPVTVLLFDVDDLKSYNDSYGHDAGDEIIRVTGELFREHCREQDIVTRYGGDEFAVVFWDAEGPRAPGSTHPDGVLSVLSRFKAALRSRRFARLGPKGQGKLTISGGLATYPWDGLTSEALVTKADEALLAAKRAGKNRIFLIGEADQDQADGS